MNELFNRIKELAEQDYKTSTVDLRTGRIRKSTKQFLTSKRYIYTGPDGTEYYTIAMAAAATGLSVQTIRNRSWSNRKGWKIREATSEEDIQAVIAADRKLKPVISHEGIEFRSATDAALHYKVPLYKIVTAAREEHNGWKYK